MRNVIGNFVTPFYMKKRLVPYSSSAQMRVQTDGIGSVKGRRRSRHTMNAFVCALDVQRAVSTTVFGFKMRVIR
jgi:hypothetical protein